MDLKAIKERCEAATPGPWHMAMPACDHPDCAALDDTSSVECSETGVCVFDCAEDKDAAFIAHARTDLPALVSWVARAASLLCLCSGHAQLAKDHSLIVAINKLLAELDQGPRGV